MTRDTRKNTEFVKPAHSCYPYSMLKKPYRYNIILRPEPEGGFTVTIPSLPGCVTYGRNLEEAKEMARDAVRGYITSLKKHNEPVPTDADNMFASLDLSHV